MASLEERYIRFDALWEKYQNLVMYMCLSYARYDDELGKDYSQEVALAIYANVAQLRQDANTFAEIKWIRKVTIATLRKHDHKTKIDIVPLKKEAFEKVIEETNVAAERLDELMHYLNDSEYLLLKLILEGFNYKEIAMINGSTESAVKVQVFRIKKKIIAIQEKNKLI